MLWLEMSRDSAHGGGDWGFRKCLWSPARKKDGSKWGFWETVYQTQAGDTVLHLRGIGDKAAFVGFSTVESDGYETTERPPNPGQWSFANSFYRASLKDFVSFPNPISLQTVFKTQNQKLRDYFFANKNKTRHLKKRLFYVIQAGRIQCLNGAYLSEVDTELANIIIGDSEPYQRRPVDNQQSLIRESVNTNEQVRELKSRIGQSDFSERVRLNYNHQCCFPKCGINERRFLIGAHIARWADKPEMRGDISNGLCLCLMHDKAFEAGLFTISSDLRVWVHKEKMTETNWGTDNLLPYHGEKIKMGNILPSEESLRYHWQRIGLNPIT